jgi:hypothetical protein
VPIALDGEVELAVRFAMSMPSPGECMGEQHACKRQCTDALAGPAANRGKRSVSGHEQTCQTEKTPVTKTPDQKGRPRGTDQHSSPFERYRRARIAPAVTAALRWRGRC